MQTQPAAVLALADACRFLNLSDKSVRNLVARNEIPFRRAGKHLLFGRAALERWGEGHDAEGGR